MKDMSDGDLYLLFAQRLAGCIEIIAEIARRYPRHEDPFLWEEETRAQELAVAASRTLLEASGRERLGACPLCRT